MKYLKTYNENTQNAQLCVIVHNLKQIKELKKILEETGYSLFVPTAINLFLDQYKLLYVYILPEKFAWIHLKKRYPDVIHIDFENCDKSTILSIIEGDKLGLI